jgi:glycerol uptake facilitator-like aquaporin
MNPRLLKQCAAEFVGTFTLIFVGVGTATGAISGGQLNPAVTFGLLIGGQMDVKKSIAYWISQRFLIKESKQA